jgi:RND family efflux transporter MFP subunit
MNWKKTALICLLIFGLAAAVTTLIYSTEPTAQKEGATKESAMLVNVVPVRKGTFTPLITTTGIVQPEQDILLSPRIEGMITSLSSGFVPGGFVREGQVLLTLDPSDYENQLKIRESELGQAMAQLRIEMGQQEVARTDYELVDRELSADKKALALREPQLDAVEASVDGAQAMVNQAQLQLDRTTIRAPFNAQVITRDANVGSQVSPGVQLARLVGTDAYWVVATVPMAQVGRISIPNRGGGRGAKVQIRSRSAWPDSIHREGYLYQLMGTLDQQTRLARVMVRVADPLDRSHSTDEAYPLMIGSFVETQIPTRPLKDVVRMNRDYLRQNETVWVMEGDELRIRSVDIAFKDARYAYVSSGLQDGDQVVTTNLSTVVNGAPLRLEGGTEMPIDSSLTSSK